MGGNTFLYSIRLATWRNLAVCYVGISKRPHYRFKQHCRSKTPFGEAIRALTAEWFSKSVPLVRVRKSWLLSVR